jgi:Tol biopolymer transport system component
VVRAALMLRLAAAAIMVLIGCTSGGNAEAGSQASTASPSTRLSPSSPASSEPSPAASGPVDVSSLTGRIAFSNGTEDIWVINADGSGLHRLTSNPAHDFDPAWSPDGRTLAFRSERDGNSEIYLMSANGSRQHNLSRDRADDWGPTWSPDGQVLWNCARGVSFGFRACVEDPDGTGLHVIPADIYVEYPAWSPDATKIAFMSQEPGASGTDPDYNIYVMNADGTGITRLTGNPSDDGFPSWSPDGQKIAFASTRDDCSNSDRPDCRTTGDIGPFFTLYVMNADGSDQDRLTDTFAQFVDWSPDGQYLVFAPGLNIIRPDGSGLTSLQPGVAEPEFPDWAT